MCDSTFGPQEYLSLIAILKWVSKKKAKKIKSGIESKVVRDFMKKEYGNTR